MLAVVWQVCGRPLVTYCLEALQKVAWVSQVVVVADDLVRMTGVVRAAELTKVKVVQVSNEGREEEEEEGRHLV